MSRNFKRQCQNILNSSDRTEYYLINQFSGINKLHSRIANQKRKDDLRYRKLKLKIDSKSRMRLREQIMENLGGPVCIFCGYCSDIRALHIDHKYSDGKIDKKRFKSNIEMYRYYRDRIEESRMKLQVLCANCNSIKRHTNREWGRFLHGY